MKSESRSSAGSSRHYACPEEHHQHSLDELLKNVSQICAQKGLRLTDVRKRVLTLIWQAQSPIGAYALLEILQQHQTNAKPPTIYRALDFLLEHRFIHRISSLNAYIACAHPEYHHSAYFFICKSCNASFEISHPALDQTIEQAVQPFGCRIENKIIEVTGLCKTCLLTK
ncbi:transcriptional repressor [Piscirickettsia litoralis]|uniref:Ferric uptake regulator family protein n=1 Tax=Piscirickettsia litoralis TaxID=1891921 RepID=A0ABX3AB50_9GAMM|nr:transcriptional repressor [Piscirickettsia litoralis]ODN43364.1 ferric uptake regulator family protein [Piscirickettsia litoralis]